MSCPRVLRVEELTEVFTSGGKNKFFSPRTKTSKWASAAGCKNPETWVCKSKQRCNNPAWLDSSTFPKISYTLENLDNLKWRGKSCRQSQWQTDDKGQIDAHFRANIFTIPASQPQGIRRKEWRHPLSNRSISLSRGQFGINTGTALDSILDLLTVKIQLVAGSDTVRPFLPCRLFGGRPESHQSSLSLPGKSVA